MANRRLSYDERTQIYRNVCEDCETVAGATEVVRGLLTVCGAEGILHLMADQFMENYHSMQRVNGEAADHARIDAQALEAFAAGMEARHEAAASAATTLTPAEEGEAAAKAENAAAHAQADLEIARWRVFGETLLHTPLATATVQHGGSEDDRSDLRFFGTEHEWAFAPNGDGGWAFYRSSGTGVVWPVYADLEMEDRIMAVSPTGLGRIADALVTDTLGGVHWVD